jgi:hypothetical protein
MITAEPLPETHPELLAARRIWATAQTTTEPSKPHTRGRKPIAALRSAA